MAYQLVIEAARDVAALGKFSGIKASSSSGLFSSARSSSSRNCAGGSSSRGCCTSLLFFLVKWTLIAGLLLFYLSCTGRIQLISPSSSSPLANQIRYSQLVVRPYALRFEAHIRRLVSLASTKYDEVAPASVKLIVADAQQQLRRTANWLVTEVWPQLLRVCIEWTDRLVQLAIRLFHQISDFLAQ